MTREERQKQLNEELAKLNTHTNTIGLIGYDYLRASWCRICTYYHGHDKCSCEAYPRGIPDKFALVRWGDKPLKHTEIESNQVGSFIFKSTKDGL